MDKPDSPHIGGGLPNIAHCNALPTTTFLALMCGGCILFSRPPWPLLFLQDSMFFSAQERIKPSILDGNGCMSYGDWNPIS
jgi:hypothetical protein